MTRRFCITILGIAALGIVSGAGSAKPSLSSIRKAIQAQYDRGDVVLKTRNPDRVKSLFKEVMTPDFVWDPGHGQPTNNLAQVSAYWSALTVRTKNLRRFHTTILKIEMKDENTAVVTDELNHSWDQADSHGKLHRFNSRDRSKTTWVHTSSGWKMKRMLGLMGHTWMDGKPFNADPLTLGAEKRASKNY